MRQQHWLEIFFLLLVSSFAREGSSSAGIELRGGGLRHAALQVDAQHSSGHTGKQATSLIGVVDVARQQPIPYKTRETHWIPSFKGKTLNSCFIIALVGVSFAVLGLVVLWYFFKKREASELFMGDKARRTNANVTGKRHYTTQTDESTTHHWVASYTFEGVRDDGMRCRVTTKERNFKQEVWNTLEVGQDSPVFYAVRDPGCCRLMQQATLDHANTQGPEFMLNLTMGLLFVVPGFLIGVVLSACCGLETSGVMGALLCIGLWFVCTAGCFAGFKPLVEWFAGHAHSDVKELGLQQKADHLGDLSGLWLLESDFGSFEYNFTAVSDTVVMVKGRPKGREDWDPEFEGHFAGEKGHELVWDDDEKAHFRLVFDGPDAFAGSLCTAAGDVMTFKGTRDAVIAASSSD